MKVLTKRLVDFVVAEEFTDTEITVGGAAALGTLRIAANAVAITMTDSKRALATIDAIRRKTFSLEHCSISLLFLRIATFFYMFDLFVEGSG